MNQSTMMVKKMGLPDGFVYIDELIDDCIIDAKYAGTDNFLGRVVAGYDAPLVVMSKEAAQGCVQAAEVLRKQGYVMKFYDAFRPQRAVNDFIAWGDVAEDQRRKPVHYPNVEKLSMFELGYISKKSGHSRGSAVDLTLVDAKTHQELDMGSIFDYMDERSHHGAKDISPQQEKNRNILRDAMLAFGFQIYDCEWWHYNLKVEPYADTYFDFPIK